MAFEKRFSSGVSFSLAARVLMAGNSVVAGILVARLLGAESFGILVVLNVTVSTLIQISTFGITTANTYRTAPDRSIVAPVTVNGVLFSLIAGTVTAIATWVLSSTLLPGVPTSLALIGLMSVPFQLVSLVISSLFLARAEVKASNYIDLFNQSFILINPLIALLLFSSGLYLLVSLNLAAAIVVSVVAVAAFYRYISSQNADDQWHGDLRLLTSMLKYALKGHVLWASMMIMLRVDVVILNSYRGSAEAAVYGVATQFTLFLMLLPNVVANLMLQRVAASPDKAAEFAARTARYVALVLFLASIASIPLAFLLPVAYGPDFQNSVILVWLLLPGVIVSGVQLSMVQYFVGTGLPKAIPLVWIITLVVNISLNFLFVERYGAMSAAIISTLCYFISSAVIYGYFKRSTGISLRDVLICRLEEMRNLRRLITIK